MASGRPIEPVLLVVEMANRASFSASATLQLLPCRTLVAMECISGWLPWARITARLYWLVDWAVSPIIVIVLEFDFSAAAKEWASGIVFSVQVVVASSTTFTVVKHSVR